MEEKEKAGGNGERRRRRKVEVKMKEKEAGAEGAGEEKGEEGEREESNGTANKMNGALDHSDQPDPDAIKMFVGQIPRSWSEKELKELFEPYGAVYQINVLRDRSQNPPQSKGPFLQLWLATESLRDTFTTESI
ncbi:hypothetical protein Chor_009782 [Crotalus horridus]